MPGRKTVVSKVIRQIGLFLFGLIIISTVLIGLQSSKNQAYATANAGELNFQARLLTASGAIVPDGSYNIDFKLYNASSSTSQAVGSCTSGGSNNCEWEESYVYSGYSGAHASNPGPQVVVKDGYLSVYLGQYNAFPTTINWEQPQYLTMNIDQNGTTNSGAITWDGEMAPRILMTALPYAFTSSQMATNSGSNRGVLQFGTVATNPVITLPDATGTVCLQSATACNFAPGTAASYVDNGTSPQSASFNVTGTGAVAGALTLGTASSANGSIVFDTSGAGTVTIVAGATGTSYSLTLPTSGPQSNECIMTASGSSTQLVFGSCNGGPTVTHVQETDANATNMTSLSTFKPQAEGDLIVLAIKTVTGNPVTSVTGGNVRGWTFINGGNDPGNNSRIELWYGTIYLASPSVAVPINVNFTNNSPGVNVEMVTDEFASGNGAGSVWSVDTSNSTNHTGTTSLTYPSLTPAAAGEVYWGYGNAASAASAGSTAGFTFTNTAATTGEIAYDVNTSSGTAYQPIAHQASSSTSQTSSVLFTVTAGKYVNNGTTTQLGNLNLESATSGAVTATLQGNPAGTADILDILTGAGTNVLSVGSSGNTTITNSVSTSQLSAPGTVTVMLAPTAPTATPGGTGGTTAYSYEVSAVANGIATLPSPAGSTGNTANAILSSTSGNNVGLSWTAVTGATSYIIYRTVSGGSPASIGYIGTSTTNSFTDTGIPATGSVPAAPGGLINGTTYYFLVTAIDGTGGQTIPSSPETTGVAATTGTNLGVTVSWAPVPGARGYNVWATTLSGSETHYQTVYTNGYTLITGPPTLTPGALPTTNTAYNNSLNGTGSNSEITLGDTASSSSSAQLDVAGYATANALATVSTEINAVTANPWAIYTQGSYAYIVNNASNNLQIYDISNPANPALISTTATGSGPHSVYVQGSYAYVADNTAGTMQIFDISNPMSPFSVSNVTTVSVPFSIVVSGNYAYVANNLVASGLQIYDVSNPANPISLSVTATTSGPHSIYIQGRYVYVADFSGNTMQIFDVGNPSNPILISTTTTNTGPQTVNVVGRYAYVGNLTAATFQIFDISNPYSPALLSSVSTAGNPRGVVIQGHYAYVVTGIGTSLQIYDISNPYTTPVLINTVPITNTYGISIQGRYAFTINFNSSTFSSWDLGGAYIQQLQAGAIQTTNLEVDGNSTVTGTSSIMGGLVVGASADINGSVSLNGNLNDGSILKTTDVPTPDAPSVTPTGTVGTTSYSYAIAAVGSNGNTTPASSSTATTTGNATLSSSNYNVISWSPVQGAASYNIYRTASSGTPSTTGLIGNVAATATPVFNDTGIAGTTVAPSVDGTGQLIVTGASTTSFQINSAAGVNVLNVDTVNDIVGTASTSTASTNSSNFTIQSGNATGTSSNSGNVSIDVGTATGTKGSITIGGTNAPIVNIGTAAISNTINIGTTATNTSNTQSINIGATNVAGTTNILIGTGTGATGGTLTLQSHQTLLIGNSVSPTITMDTSSGGVINIGDTTSSSIGIGTFAANNFIQIGTGVANTGNTQQINIGYTSAAGIENIFIGAGGAGSTAGNTTIQGKTNLFLGNGNSTNINIDTSSGGVINVGDSTGTNINIGTAAIANTIQIGTTATNTSNTQAIDIGNTNVAGTTNIIIGTGASATGGTLALQSKQGLSLGNGISSSISMDTASAGTITIGNTNATTTIGRSGAALTLNGSNFSVTSGGNVVASGTYNTNTFTSSSLTFGSATASNISIATPSSNGVGAALTVSGGPAAAGASAFSGGALNLYGGNAAGTGNANGGNVILQGGTGVGTGVVGLVGLNSPVDFNSVSYSTGISATITQADVDGYGTISTTATTTSLTLTVPSPTNTTAGRILYLANVGTNTFTANIGSSSYQIEPNGTSTLLWTGSSWTNAGIDGGSLNYIDNQTSVQASSNFNISGTGIAGTSLLAPLFSTSTGTTSASLTLSTGAASSGASGNISIDTGTFTSGSPTITIGNTNATTTIGRSGAALTLNGSNFSVATGGAVSGGTYNTNTFTSTALTLAGTNPVISAGTSNSSLTLQANGTGTLNLGTTATANTIQIGTTATNTGNTQTINIGNTNVAGTTNVVVGAGASATGGSVTLQSKGNLILGNAISAVITMDTASAGTITIGNTNATTTIGRSGAALTLNGSNFSVATGGAVSGGTYNTNTFNGTTLTFGSATASSISIATPGSNGVGAALTITGGTAAAGASAFSGGALNLQGGNAAGTGNANGANVILQGGTGVGSGVVGLVNVNSPAAFTSVSYSTGISATITQADIDGYGTIAATATTTSLTLTVPNPTITTAGRLLYLENVGTNTFSITIGSVTYKMEANGTSTLLWNGTAWSNAGVDAGSPNYINNQTTQQTSANFDISGNGQAAGFDASVAGVFNLGITTATSIQLGSTTNTTSGVTISTAGSFTLNGVASSTYAIGSNTTTGTITIGGAAQTGNIYVGNSSSNESILLGNGSGNATIVLGNSTNSVTFNPSSSSAPISCTGNGCQAKQIVMTPEYAGAVLDTGGQTADIGTMVSGFDSTQRESYYQWTTAQGANETYDVVAQIPLPSDFNTWTSSTPITFDLVSPTSTTGASVKVALWDTSGASNSTNLGYSGSVPACSITIATTWATQNICAISGGTFTANGVITLRIRLQANANATELGNIVLKYNSTL